MRSKSNLSGGSEISLRPFDELKDCRNENVNLDRDGRESLKYFHSSLELNIGLIKRLTACHVLAVFCLSKDFLSQILIKYILQNGIKISPLVWEFVQKYAIFPKHHSADDDRHSVEDDGDEKILIRDNYTPGEANIDPLITKSESLRVMNFPTNNTLINLEQSLKEINLIDNNTLKERNLEFKVLSFEDIVKDTVYCKEEKWRTNFFLSDRNNIPFSFLVFPLRRNISQSFDKLFQGTPRDDFEIMKFEFHRFSSFRNYAYPDVPSAILLAKAGWFATGNEKETKTFCCLSVYNEWKIKDDPNYIHKMLSPACFFISGEDIGQISFHDRSTNGTNEATVDSTSRKGCLAGSQLEQFSYTSQEEILYERTDHIEPLMKETVHPNSNSKVYNEEINECDSESFVQQNGNSEVHSTNIISNLNWNISDALYPHQSEYEARVESFAMVNKSHYALKTGLGSEKYVIANKTAEEFARAGLFYRGFRDRTSCFYCGIGLQNWTSVDDIIQRHYQSSENCPIAQAYLHGINTDRDTATVENCIVTSQNQSRDSTCAVDIFAELGEIGFSQNQVKAAIDSLRQRGLSYTKERIANEILDNRAAFIQSLPSFPGSPQSHSVNFNEEEEEEALDFPNMQINSGENAEKTNASNFQEQSADQLRQRVTCKVCLSEEVGVLFLPCSHLVSCVSCSPRLKKCPLCRKYIQTKQPMYW